MRPGPGPARLPRAAGSRATYAAAVVILSRIYTKTGDAGTTDLGDMSRTHKTDPRLVAYADTDEANCAIGEALAGAPRAELDDDVVQLLLRVQNDLFDVGADLCTPLRPTYEYPPLRVTEAYVADLEQAIDTYNADLPKLRSFVLPGGTLAAARLHTARTVVRRAERSTWEALERYGSEAVAAEDGAGGVSALDRPVPQPALGPAVRAVALRQPRRRRRHVGPGRRPPAGAAAPRPEPRLTVDSGDVDARARAARTRPTARGPRPRSAGPPARRGGRARSRTGP